MIIINYWNIIGRGGGLYRMCLDHGEVEWKRNPDGTTFGVAFDFIAPSPTGPGETTNLAPPVVEDVDAGIRVSQCMPCYQYLGNKLGFNKGIAVPEIAMQYMGDVNDLMNEMNASLGFKLGMKADEYDVQGLKAYLHGERYRRHLATIDRQIKGPFYFGDEPTYVDYCVTTFLDILEGKLLRPLESRSGDTIGEGAPKLRAVADAIRAKTKDDPEIKDLWLVSPWTILTAEKAAEWDEGETKGEADEAKADEAKADEAEA